MGTAPNTSSITLGLQSKLTVKVGGNQGYPGSGKARRYRRAPGASLVSFAAVNYWVSTCLQFWNKLWWLLILDYSLGPKCFDNNCPKERVRNNNYSIGEQTRKKKQQAVCTATLLQLLLTQFLPTYPVKCSFQLTGPGWDQRRWDDASSQMGQPVALGAG